MVENLSVIGLGKLGASMLAGMASRGFNVIGVDIAESAVLAVNGGRAPVQETGLDEMISAHRDRIRATTSHEEAVLGSDVSFVIVPTPSDRRGAFELQYARYAFEQLGKALAKKNSYHVVVLTSTVIPGATRHGLLPVLEAASGKKCGEDFGLCYSPEFIALGSVIRDFLNPDFFLVGEFDERSGKVVEEVNRRISVKEPVVRRMSIENAEIAKIALNSYVTMKISFANTLADLCERIPGGDVDVVSDAIGSDSRIGRKYLTGGLGFGGPCFPRDNVALGFLCDHVGADASLLVANHGYNTSMSTRIAARFAPLLRAGQTVAVLGLAYKPLSHVVEESQGVALALAMAESGMRVIGYDPLASEGARSAFRDKALVAESVESALVDAALVVVTTPDDRFRALTAEELLGSKESVTVVDCWRCLDPGVANHPDITYVPLGRCLDDEPAATALEEIWAEPRVPSS
jgi:UDPglucose 6-dehydrogenase